MKSAIHDLVRILANFINKAYGWLGGRWFFATTILVFFLHTVWIALSSNLLPYDEYYHIGLIKYYAGQWSPFIAFQPTELSYLGDITRLPSYMYHYLMSFPYRIFSFFIENETTIVILMRLTNVLLVILAVIIFRKLFIKIGISQRIVNITATIFLMTPFVTMLSAQNNYDNLVLLLTASLFWFAHTILSEEKGIFKNSIIFTAVGLGASLVKNTFLVIFITIFSFTALYLAKKYGVRVLVKKLRKDLQNTRKTTVICLLIPVVLLAALFIERHGYNLVRYKTINPDCLQIQPQSVCIENSPWRRNYEKLLNPPTETLFSNIGGFSVHWGTTMMSGMYPIFAHIQHEVGSRPDIYGDYSFKKRLTILLAVGYMLLFFSIMAFISIRKVYISPTLTIGAVTLFVLGVTLFIFNYNTYKELGRAYAIQVRYFYPLILPAFVIASIYIQRLIGEARLKNLFVITIVAIYMLWGGAIGWIIRADASWYWPNQTVFTVNQKAQSILKKVVPN